MIRISYTIVIFVILAFLVCRQVFAFSMTTEEANAQYKYLTAIDNKRGTMEKILEAEKTYEQLLKTNISENEIKYQFRLASLTAVKATHVFWPHEKLGYANDSIRRFGRLERKVDRLKDKELEYEFHLYRGRTFIHFPFFLNKREIAMKDLQKAAEMAEQLDRPKEELGPFYLEYAQNLKNDGNLEMSKFYAKKALENMLAEDQIERAKKMLK